MPTRKAFSSPALKRSRGPRFCMPILACTLGLWAKMLGACHAGQWSVSIETGERLVAVTRRAAVYLGLLGMIYAKSGQPEKALTMREDLILRREAGEYVSPIAFLVIDYAVGDMRTARDELEVYLADGNGWGISVMLGCYLDDFAADPLCAEMLPKMGWPLP